MTVQKILSLATEKLEKNEIETPRLDAEILLAFVLNWQRLKLYTDSEKLCHLERTTRLELATSTLARLRSTR